MLLEVHERLALLTLLPKKGDYAALKNIRRAREMLSFTPEEIELYELRNGVNPETGKPRAEWNTKKAAEVVRDIPMDEYVVSIFRDALAEMNRKHALTDEFMSLYEKLVIIYQ